MLQGKDPTIVQKNPNNQMIPFKQAVGDSGKEKTKRSFKRKKPSREPRLRHSSMSTQQ